MPVQSSLRLAPLFEASGYSSGLVGEEDEVRNAQADPEFDLRRKAKGWTLFESFFDHHMTSNPDAPFPGAPDAAKEYLSPNFPQLDYASLSLFCRYYACTGQGVLTDKPTVTSCLSVFQSLWDHLQEKTGHQYEASLRGNVRYYVRTELTIDPGIEDIVLARHFTDIDGLEEMAWVLFDPECRISGLRQRVQMLFWLAITMQTGARVGTFFPTDRHEGNGLRYGHLRLSIDAKGVHLHITPPNGKTLIAKTTTFHCDAQERLWCCPIFWILVLAINDNALPRNVTAEAILEGKMREDGGPVHYDFQQQDMHVCRQTFDATSRTWTTTRIRDILEELSFLAGFQAPLTPHDIRRSVAIMQLLAGGGFNGAALRLGHEIGDKVTRLYLTNLIGDVKGALYDEEELNPEAVRQILLSHPNRLHAYNGRRQYNIGPDGRRRCMDDPHVRAAGDEYELQKAAFTNDGTTPIAELSAEQRQKLNRLYHKYGNEFQRALHEQICSRYGLAGDQVTDDMRTGQPAPPENAEDFDYDLLHMEHVLATEEFELPDVDVEDLARTAPPSPQDRVSAAPTFERSSGPASITATFGSAPPLMIFETPFSILRDLAFAKNRNQAPLALRRFLEGPKTQAGNAVYFPGFAPGLGNVCPTCNQPLTDATDVTASGVLDQDLHRAAANHLVKCPVEHQRTLAQQRNLKKYPSWTMDWTKDHSTSIDRTTVIDCVSNLLSRFARIGKPRGETSVEPIVCKQCLSNNPNDTAGATIWTMGMAYTHYLLKHEVFLPEPAWSKSKHGLDIWNEEIKFPAVLDFSTREVITDPTEVEEYSMKLYHQRIESTRDNVEVYGVNPLLRLERDDLPDDRRHTARSDTKYLLVRDRGRHPTQLGLCFMCVNDPRKSWTDRMRLHTDASNMSIHVANCIRGEFQTIEHRYAKIMEVDRGAILTRGHAAGRRVRTRADLCPHPLFDDEQRLRCPDVVCLKNRRTFDTRLKLCGHIVAVHHVRLDLHGIDDYNKLRGGASSAYDRTCLSDLVPKSEGELIDWARGRNKTSQAAFEKRRLKALAAAAADSDAVNSESSTAPKKRRGRPEKQRDSRDKMHKPSQEGQGAADSSIGGSEAHSGGRDGASAVGESGADRSGSRASKKQKRSAANGEAGEVVGGSGGFGVGTSTTGRGELGAQDMQGGRGDRWAAWGFMADKSGSSPTKKGKQREVADEAGEATVSAQESSVSGSILAGGELNVSRSARELGAEQRGQISRMEGHVVEEIGREEKNRSRGTGNGDSRGHRGKRGTIEESRNPQAARSVNIAGKKRTRSEAGESESDGISSAETVTGSSAEEVNYSDLDKSSIDSSVDILDDGSVERPILGSVDRPIPVDRSSDDES